MQLETYERVKDKVSSTSAPFSKARERLLRANSGINVRPASDSRAEAAPSSSQPEAATATETRSPFQTPPRAPITSYQTPPRAATTTPERVHRMLVASPAVDLTPTKQTPAMTPSTTPNRAPPPRQSSDSPVSPPLNHPAVLNSTAGGISKQQSDAQKGAAAAGETAHGAPLTPERMPSGRMHSGRIPPGLATQDGGEPGCKLKPIQTSRSLSRGERLPRPYQ